ncbi:MAG: N-acetylmuramoyl-L-alanine amidase [Clostridia bacterium]|nr:N-acetylmuramoyl-L-alanine amidase [Deltaproteobacteria bacterium]
MLFFSLALLAALPLVVVDAGHGGVQDGAIGVCGVKEKDVTLAIATEVARILQASGQVRTEMTRTGDATLDLGQRATFSNEAGADLFVSIHANSGPRPKTRGIETYYLSATAHDRQIQKLVSRENEGVTQAIPLRDEERILKSMQLGATQTESARLAERVHGTLSKTLEVRGRGVMQAPFYVLLASHTPSVLVEVGFLTNLEECNELGDAKRQTQISEAVASAVLLHTSLEELAHR